ncbi:hypothetical protein D3C78_1920120 [compost metagenome]
MLKPDDVVVGGQVLTFVCPEIGMPVMPVGVGHGIDPRHANGACQALERFDQEASRAHAFKVLG